VTEKVQALPVLGVQITFELPTGKTDPEGGAQLIVPQAPVELGGG
jgi:hypothetical protein